MSQWQKSTRKPTRPTPEARLHLTKDAVITVADYGWADNRINATLCCRLGNMYGPLDQACAKTPAELIPLVEETLAALRALVNSESEQVDFPAAVDPVAASEAG